ncbi:MAG TPA: cytochrome c3 family protein [Gemmatimonadales bacterium]|nr:cytochrome c3 family protein [Gemmatimonadales bacterium]
MPALFPPRSNRIARGVLVAALVLAVAVPVGLMVWVRTPAVTEEGRRVVQPVQFDHRIHAADLKIDCRYCHYTVDRTAMAGMPATETCVPCHKSVWLSGAPFTPVRQSLARTRAIPWVRVNRLPDFVYFNHAIHVKGGIACESCHGRVDRMAEVRQAAPLTMGWCLDCHRNPEPHRRPASAVVAMGWSPAPHAAPVAPLGAERIRAITSCSACHR